MRQIKAILFDKDGTLFDFNKTWANWSQKFLMHLAADDLVRARRLGDAVGFDIAAGMFRKDSILVSATPHDITDALLPHLPGAMKSNILRLMSRLTAEVPQAEATPLEPLLSELIGRGLVLGVVTNDTLEPTRRHLQEFGVTEAFAMVLASDSGFAAKPAPDMLLAFSETVGLDPAEIVMIGDSSHDLVAARAAGMPSIAVLTGIADRAQLEPLADAVLPSVAGLPGWLDQRCPTRSAA
ncbi:HAD family hydrolase [Meridianimarinicoccus sp. MJW13]|uniref:HAD family hydrolase n=1 Tax=Meridianimarinicoccus sp. MJW13 TaxID=2720031 RepID=UPI0018672336|nr:HAD family hydrolase [Fluviibacterium sp. MJW13]